jgi:hypothetical protein
MTPEDKAYIDGLSYEELLRQWTVADKPKGVSDGQGNRGG